MDIQRFADILLSSLALLVLAPLLIIVAAILRFTGEGEIFFRQERVGGNGRPFKLLKFATMLKDSPNMGTGTITLQNDARILPVGRILRKTKFNELPQLLNVLKGDMSIIGPRPQTPRCFNAFPDEIQQKIIKVRPGISGIGSIIFRDEEILLGRAHDTVVFYDQIIAPYKGELERWYIENRSLRLYCLMIFLTGFVILFPRSRLAWRLFADLPKPPEELANYFHKGSAADGD